jgi:hypothetical protein
MKNNNLIVAQAFMLLCAFALPFISLYCQDKPRKLTRIPKYKYRQMATQKKKFITTDPIPAPELATENTDAPPTQKVPTTASQETEDASTQENTTISSDETKQAQINPQAQRPQISWYNKFAPLLLAALYKGSETGINAFVNSIVKLFTKRRDTLIELEKQKEKYIATIPEENKKEEIQQIDTQLKEFKKTSLSSIAATGIYTGMLNTAVPMMGILMGSTIKIALQMLMPVENY